MDNETIEALRRSKIRIRWFYPVIKAKDGTVIDGNHRLAADPNWKVVTLADVDTDEKKVLARIACNFVRREVPQAEKREMLGTLASLGWDARKIAEETGIPLRTVYEHLPAEVKKPTGPKGPRKEIAAPAISSSTVGTAAAETELVDKEARTKKIPFSKGVSPTASQFAVKTFKEPAVRFANYLMEAGVVDVLVEAEYPREGELTEDGRPKFYSADIAVKTAMVVIEVEGEGSASRDNPERDAFFAQNGYVVLHLSNGLVKDYGGEVAELLAPLIIDRGNRQLIE